MKLLLPLLLLLPLSAHAAWQTPGVPTAEMAQAQPAVQASVSTQTAYFPITAEDIGAAVAEQLKLQAVEQKAQVSLAAGTPATLYSADHPLKVAIHALQIDAQSHRWQAQAYMLAGGKTEMVKPVSGTYLALVDVPVLSRQLSKGDIIEQKDITVKAVPDKFLRKDSITDAKLLLGQSLRATISADRPIRRGRSAHPSSSKRASPLPSPIPANS